MKHLKSILLVTLCWSFTFSFANTFLDIRHIGVGHGDCTLITASDASVGKMVIVLIDAGDRGRGTSIVWPYLKSNLTGIVNQTGVYFIIISSHLHSDHIGGMDEVLDSIRLTPTPGWGTGVVTKIIDRSINASYIMGGTSCYDESVDDPSSGVFNQYNTAAVAYGSGKRTNIDVTNDIFAAAGLSNAFAMICVASNGQVPGNNVVNGSPKNENDLSYGFMVGFGKFKYFTAGDLGGGGGNYTDMETPLCNSVYVQNILKASTTPHVCALKISHHGSAHSSNKLFLQTFNPALGVFEAALRSFSGTPLPTTDAYNTLNKGIGTLLFTYKLSTGNAIPGTASSQIEYYQDVILKVTNPAPDTDGHLNFDYIINVKAKEAPYAQVSTSTSHFTCNKIH